MANSMRGQIDPYAQAYNTWTYQRPNDWLILPTVEETEEKFVGLFPVFNVIGNFVALQFEGDYTVDWGDGTVEDIASGVKAQHSYDYSAIDASTESTRGYRQVLITVTPQVGQNLTSLDLSVRHDIETYFPTSAPWLDFILSVPNYGMNPFFLGLCQLLEVCTVVTTGTATDITEFFAFLDSLQTVYLLNLPNVEGADELFTDCKSLRQVHLPEMPVLQYAADMFFGCDALEKVIIDGMPMIVDFSYMFYERFALQHAEVHNTPAGEDFSSMFSYCYSLNYAVVSDMSAATSTLEMFYYCYNLEKFLLPATPLLEDAYYMFEYCYSLTEARLTDLSSLQFAGEMFYECYSLTEINFPPTPLLADIEYLLSGCGITKVSFSDLSSLDYAYSALSSSLLREFSCPELPVITNLDYCFGIYTLTKVNLTLSNSSGVSMRESFYYCTSLHSVTIENSQYITDLFGAFYGCYLLSSVNLPGLIVSVNLSYCSLSRDAIVSLFNDLGTASEIINLTGNFGTADLTGPDIAVATGKGWTVNL